MLFPAPANERCVPIIFSFGNNARRWTNSRKTQFVNQAATPGAVDLFAELLAHGFKLPLPLHSIGSDLKHAAA